MSGTVARRSRRSYGHSVAAVLLVLAVLLIAAAGVVMAFFSRPGNALPAGYRVFSQSVAVWLSSVPKLLPVAAWDIGLALIILVAFVLLLVCLWQHRGRMLWLATASVLVAATLFCSVVLWGLNFYAPPLAQEVGLSGGALTAESLAGAATYYWDKAAQLSEGAPRDVDGELVAMNFDEAASLVPGAYVLLAQRYPALGGEVDPVMPLTLGSRPLQYTGHRSCYFLLTGEASLSPECAAVDLPFEMGHVSAHRLGIASEADADLASFLACAGSGDVRLEYAAYCRALRLCLDALEAHELGSAIDLANPADEAHALVVRDLIRAEEFYSRYDGIAADIGRAVEDVYLRAFMASYGVERLDSIAAALVAWQQQNAA